MDIVSAIIIRCLGNILCLWYKGKITEGNNIKSAAMNLDAMNFNLGEPVGVVWDAVRRYIRRVEAAVQEAEQTPVTKTLNGVSHVFLDEFEGADVVINRLRGWLAKFSEKPPVDNRITTDRIQKLITLVSTSRSIVSKLTSSAKSHVFLNDNKIRFQEWKHLLFYFRGLIRSEHSERIEIEAMDVYDQMTKLWADSDGFKTACSASNGNRDDIISQVNKVSQDFAQWCDATRKAAARQAATAGRMKQLTKQCGVIREGVASVKRSPEYRNISHNMKRAAQRRTARAQQEKYGESGRTRRRRH